MLAARQPPAAVAQAEQRVELLDQLEGQPPPAQRPDRHRVARPPGSDATSRIGNGDVEPAADVDEPVVAARQAHVARRVAAP